MTYLSNHQILASKDLHEMRSLLADLTSTDEIDVVGLGCDVDASLKMAPLADIKLFHVNYGDVSTRVHVYERDEDALMLFILTGGAAAVRHRGEDFDVSLTQGLVRDARAPLSALQDCFSSFVYSISNDILSRHARTLLGDRANLCAPDFAAKLDLSTPGGIHLRTTAHYIADALDGPLLAVNNPMVTAGMRDMFLTQLLSFFPNSYSDLLQRQPTSNEIIPYHVKRARDFIHANADRVITLEMLANQAGCGYRTLQIAFNSSFGMSPMAYVRHVRLNLAHDDLRAAGESASIREIALKRGFSHMGAFSKAYQKQFGVLPSRTRRMHD